MNRSAPLRQVSQRRLDAMAAAGEPVPFSTLGRGQSLARGRSLRFTSMDRMRDARARLAQIPSDELDLAVAAIRWQFMPLAQAARDIGCDTSALDQLVLAACRADVFARDEFCPHCGGTPVDMQHRRARGSGGTGESWIAYGMANLLAMCRAGHRLAEDRDTGTGGREPGGKGYWLDQGLDPEAVGVMFHESEEGSGVTLWLRDDGTRWPYPPEGVAGR